MSFGLLKHFKEQKKDFSAATDIPFVRHLILGHDLSAVLRLLQLKKDHPTESIKLISSRPLSRQFLQETYDSGVTQLRSTESVEALFRKYFNLKATPHSEEPVFYKDGKFHDFNGRAKPMELLGGEAFFTQKGFRFSVESLFSTEDWADLDTLLNSAQEVRHLEAFEKTEPTDLVEKNEWLISFKDYSSIRCEYLHSSISPKKFLGHLKAKDRFSSELIDLCSGASIQSALSVTLSMKKDFGLAGKTLFIPQSMTHEWGHFIVEFEEFDESRTQLCHVLILVHEEEPQSEDLAAKIKLMKRVLDRVFPQFEEAIKHEFIRFTEEMFISSVKDENLMQVTFDYPSLKFLGQMSPKNDADAQEQFLARALLN